MPRDEARTIKVKCTTWDQVEAFYTQKLKGDTLVVKMPVKPAPGEGVTVALGLPSGLVFAIDGSVTQVGVADAAGKFPVAMRMHGLTREVRERLARLVKDGREGILSSPAALLGSLAGAPDGTAAAAPPRAPAPTAAPDEAGFEPVPPPVDPRVEDVLADERQVFDTVAALRRRLLTLPAHEVLGVADDADLRAIRAGYFALARQHHPDAYARYRSPALRALAGELFVHVNRAYDRLRESALRATGVAWHGPALVKGQGWLVDAADLAHDGEPPPVEIAAEAPPVGEVAPPPAAPVAAAPPPAVTKLVPPSDLPPPAATPPSGVPVATQPAGVPAAADAPLAAGTTRKPSRTLADELFGDMQPDGEQESQPFDVSVPATTENALSMANLGRAAFAAGKFDEARGHFAAALKLDPRNRPVRALYHVASGHVLQSRGQKAEAMVQFETALGHDPQCAEALRALGRAPRTRVN